MTAGVVLALLDSAWPSSGHDLLSHPTGLESGCRQLGTTHELPRRLVRNELATGSAGPSRLRSRSKPFKGVPALVTA